MEKICSKCLEEKDYAEFYKNSRTSTGLSSRCKKCQALECHNNYVKYGDKWRKRNNEYNKNNRHVFVGIRKRYKEKHGEAFMLYHRRHARWYTPYRKGLKTQATPKWLSEAQIAEIKQIYETCPYGYEVDHIIPINGKEVRGLHVPWNLQYLTIGDNRRKSNKVP